MPRLEILICTYDDGIHRIAPHLLQSDDHISYLISWQQDKGYVGQIPEVLQKRNDVRIVILPQSKGLSINRNHALRQASGDLLLIADDDNQYTLQGLHGIIKGFQSHPDADILTFQMTDETGKPLKKYPKESFDYNNIPNGYYFSSCEIALRNQKILPSFDERFGLGSDFLGCGEEEVFLHQAHSKGKSIRYLPLVIGQTAGSTTGAQFQTQAKVRRAKGAVLYMLHGYWGALFRCLKFALLLHHPQKYHFFKDMYDGIEYVRKTQ